MTYEQAKSYVKEQLQSYLENKGINTRKPFKCLNPEHTDNKPSMSYDPHRQKCKCFSCNVDYDTFDLIAIDYNTSGGETFKRGFELYGLSVEYDHPTAASDFRNYIPSKPAMQSTANQPQPLEWNANINYEGQGQGTPPLSFRSRSARTRPPPMLPTVCRWKSSQV